MGVCPTFEFPGLVSDPPYRPRTGTILTHAGEWCAVYGDLEVTMGYADEAEGYAGFPVSVTFYRNAWANHQTTLCFSAIAGYDRYR